MFKEFLKIMWRFIPPYKKYLVASIACNVLSAAMNIFSFAALIPILQILFQIDTVRVESPMAWGDGNFKDWAFNNLNYYVCQMIDSWGAVTALFAIGLFLCVTTLIKTGLYFGASAFVVPIRTGIVRDIRNLIYFKITALPLGFFTEERKGDIIARITGDVNEIEASIMSSLDMLFKNPILIISYVGTLFFISWELTLFTLAVVPGMGWLMGVISRRLKAQSLNVQALWSDTISQVEETLGGLRIIKAFCAEDKMNKRFDTINNLHRNTLKNMTIRIQLAHPMSEFLGTVLIVIVLWFGGILVLNKSVISGPTFIYYLVILYSIINPLKEFVKATYNIPRGLASMDRVNKILKAENPIKEKENPEHIAGFEHQIEFRDVSFAYNYHPEDPSRTRWVLRHINLTIEKGKTVALVGQSGGGKSTLVDLIPRYYDIQEGEILIDGINVKDLGLHDLRQLIGNVNQEAILFNDSFRNNISFGVENATQEQIEAAAKIANAYDFIMDSESKFDTGIGDRGGRLSGGQRQRVSIARAILKNPPILILDEATSALDTESERLVQEALERLMKTRTTVAIAHRLSTIHSADEICVIHEGEIVERGTHDELIALNGYYKKLNEMQRT